MLHTHTWPAFLWLFLYSSIQPWKDFSVKSFYFFFPPPYVENFLMSFQFVSLVFNCMSKRCVCPQLLFLCFYFLHVREDIVALPQSNAIWQWSLFLFYWNFSRVNFRVKPSDCRPQRDFSLFLFQSTLVHHTMSTSTVLIKYSCTCNWNKTSVKFPFFFFFLGHLVLSICKLNCGLTFSMLLTFFWCFS